MPTPTKPQFDDVIDLLAGRYATEKARHNLLVGALNGIPGSTGILDNCPSLDGSPHDAATELVNYLANGGCLNGRHLLSLVLEQVKNALGQNHRHRIDALMAEMDHLCEESDHVPAPPLVDHIDVFLTEQSAPADYAPGAIIATLGPGDRLSVIGRTCLAWFSGSNPDRLVAAIERGACVIFVAQDIYAEAPAAWDDREVGALKADLEATQEAYSRIRRNCSGTGPGSCELRYSNASIRNSRVLHRRQNASGESTLVRFQYDLSMERGWKPYLSASAPAVEHHLRDLIVATEQIVRNAMSEEEFAFLDHSPQRQRETDLLNAINVNAGDERFWSKRRSNKSIRLVPQAAMWLTDHRSPPPPLSAQLLVTDRCTTNCRMCTHFGRASGDTLSLDEIKGILGDLRHMGTRSIVISGGEPLSREDLGDILRFARGIGIRSGLLSNGIFYEGATLERRRDVYSAIAHSCSWVQVSLDSLDETVFGKIRRGGSQGEAIAFVRDLAKVGFRSIDICLTIQRRNVEELQSHGFFTRLRSLLAHLPPDVNFRFKFAHAARVDSAGTGQTMTRKPEPFLVPEPELDKLRAHLAATGLVERTNITQIVELLRHQRDRKDIAEGRPMQSMLDDLLGDASSSRPTCKVMEAMTFIDSNGEVYPCCYTFNDNVAGWVGRSDFCVGSWRKERERGSSSESRGQEGLDGNPLYRIWTGDRYAQLRSKALPVHDAICARCTRHMAQNVLLNKLDIAFAKYLSHGGHMRRLKDCLRGIEDPADDRYDPVWL